jgi:hypothetical protein
MTFRKTLLPLFVFIFTSVAAGQESGTLRWFGDLRVRSEVDMRDFDARTPANTYTLLRTRLGVEAFPVEGVRMVIQVRDSRVFGQEWDAGTFSTLADSRNLDLHQGFVEVKKLFADELSLKVGRMELIYGNERTIGAVGWHNVGRAFDAALVRFSTPSYTVDLFGATLAEVQNYAPVATPAAVSSLPDFGADLFGAYANFNLLQGYRTDAYFLSHFDRNQTVSGKSDLKRYTIGSYLKGKSNAIDVEAEAAYQTGERRGIDIDAYMVTAGAGYSFENSPLSRLGIGYEVLSGTSQSSTKYKSFDSPFHTGHKFYGFMDYFISVPAQTNNRGLVDLLARATFSLQEHLTTNIWFHHFSYARSQNGEKTLGQELDIVTLYRYNKSLSFECGVSAFLPTHLMRTRFGGASTAFWGYLTAHVTF